MEERLIDRVPPYSLEAEQAVLSACILDSMGLGQAIDRLTPDDFYIRSHNVIFAAMVNCFKNDTPVDMLTVADMLQTTGKLEAVGGWSSVSELSGRVSTAANIDHWIDIIKDKKVLRDVIETCGLTISEAYSEPEEVDKWLDGRNAEALQIGDRLSSEKDSCHDLGYFIQQQVDLIEEAVEAGQPLMGLASPWSVYNKLTFGLHPGELTYLAGRPSHGKSAISLQWAHHIATHEDANVLFFSLEMSGRELASRLIASETKTDFSLVRSGQLGPTQWQNIVNLIQSTHNSKLVINDSPVTDIQIRTRCRKMKHERGLDAVFIDYLRYVEGERRKGDTDDRYIGRISKNLKNLAKELDIPVVCLAQLNREATRKPRPQLEDLRDCGHLEADADNVLFIYRPGLMEKGGDKTQAELIIEKQRQGDIGTAELIFEPELTRFVDKIGSMIP